MHVGTEASRYSIGSRQYGTSYGRLERLTYGCPDRMARSSRQLTGNFNSSDLQAESLDITLNSGIPVYNIFYIQVILSKTQNEAKILTLSMLGLRDENAFKILFDLKTQKVVQLTNHTHLKFLLHLLKIFMD